MKKLRGFLCVKVFTVGLELVNLQVIGLEFSPNEVKYASLVWVVLEAKHQKGQNDGAMNLGPFFYLFGDVRWPLLPSETCLSICLPYNTADTRLIHNIYPRYIRVECIEFDLKVLCYDF